MPYPDQDLFGTKEEALEKAKLLDAILMTAPFTNKLLKAKHFRFPKTHQEYDEALGQRAETRTY